MGQRFEFALDGMEVAENFHALGKNGAAGEREAVLWQISGGRAFGHAERAVVDGVEAGENLHQRGFAGAVAAD